MYVYISFLKKQLGTDDQCPSMSRIIYRGQVGLWVEMVAEVTVQSSELWRRREQHRGLESTCFIFIYTTVVLITRTLHQRFPQWNSYCR